MSIGKEFSSRSFNEPFHDVTSKKAKEESHTESAKQKAKVSSTAKEALAKFPQEQERSRQAIEARDVQYLQDKNAEETSAGPAQENVDDLASKTIKATLYNLRPLSALKIDLSEDVRKAVKTLDLEELHLSAEQLKDLAALFPSVTTLRLNKAPGITDDHLNALQAFPYLRNLSLQKCELRDQDLVRLSLLGHLETLDISHNWQITGSTFDGFVLPSLKKLRVAACNLQDESIQKLSHLDQLETLDISNNKQITGRNFRLLTPSLKEFHAAACSLTNEHILDISHFKQLQLLALTGNPPLRITTSYSSPQEISMFLGETANDLAKNAIIENLSTLSALHTSLSEEVRNAVKTLNLEKLHLSAEQLKDLAALFPSVTALHWDNAPGITVDHLKALAAFPHLREVKLRNCGLQDEDLIHLSRLRLEMLDISGNEEITGSTLNGLSLSSLKEFCLARCSLQDANIPSLSRFNQLETLDISYNEQITGSTLDSLLLPSLKEFYVACSSLREESVQKMQHFKKLEKLNINDNEQITGRDFRDLPSSLKKLLVASCNLQDKNIPDLSHLRQLQWLDLQNNKQLASPSVATSPESISMLLEETACTLATEAIQSHLSNLSILLKTLSERIRYAVKTLDLRNLNLTVDQLQKLQVLFPQATLYYKLPDVIDD